MPSGILRDTRPIIGAQVRRGIYRTNKTDTVMSAPCHIWNWYAGWGLLLIAFVSGAGLGLFFHHENFLGGYTSFRRRLMRLGHIALAALGMVNLLYAFSPWPGPSQWQTTPASVSWILGALSMPAACFLTSWNIRFRPLFAAPVTLLIMAAILTLWGAHP